VASEKKTLPEASWPSFPDEFRSEELTLNAPTAEEQINADNAIVQGKPQPLKPGELYRMTEDELREFVQDYLGNRVFTSANCRRSEDVHMVFMILALGGLDTLTKEAVQEVGIVWEYMSKAAPRSVNGYPCFFSCRLMHRDDWARASAAIKRETDHLKNLQV
jgi:hypothetical protein